MSAFEQTVPAGAAMPGLLDRERIIATAGFNRWLVPPAALCGHPPMSALPPKADIEIAEAVAKLPPDQLARFRRWFTAFEAGRTDHAEELDSTATKLGRLAGRAFAELKKRAKEPRE